MTDNESRAGTALILVLVYILYRLWLFNKEVEAVRQEVRFKQLYIDELSKRVDALDGGSRTDSGEREA